MEHGRGVPTRSGRSLSRVQAREHVREGVRGALGCSLHGDAGRDRRGQIQAEALRRAKASSSSLSIVSTSVRTVWTPRAHQPHARTRGRPSGTGGSLMAKAKIKSDGRTITVRVPISIRKRGGRKVVLAPDDLPCARPEFVRGASRTFGETRRPPSFVFRDPASWSVWYFQDAVVLCGVLRWLVHRLQLHEGD